MRIDKISARMLLTSIGCAFLFMAMGSWPRPPAFDPESAAALIYSEKRTVPVVAADSLTSNLLSFSEVLVEMIGTQHDKRMRAYSRISYHRGLDSTNTYDIQLISDWYQGDAKVFAATNEIRSYASRLNMDHLSRLTNALTPDRIQVTLTATDEIRDLVGE